MTKGDDYLKGKRKDNRCIMVPNNTRGNKMPTICEELIVIRSNYATGLTLFGLLMTLGKDTINRNRIILKEDGLSIVQPGQILKINPHESCYEVSFGGTEKWNIKHAATEFSKMLLRNITNDSFETLKEYCEETNQSPRMQGQAWYDFARLVRNALTHNQHWLLCRPHDKVILPLTWRGKTIETSMDGKELTFDFYDWYDGAALWDDTFEFAKSLK